MNDRPDTKWRILDAAEKLFGMKGFEATSLRDITAEAQVNLAAVNYHFQSKDSLIDAVIARIIRPVNQKRLEKLDAAGPSPTLEEILAAFLGPVLELDLANVAPLLGRMMSEPNLFVERIFKTHLAPVSQRFQEAIHEALPELPRAEVAWRMHFVVGIMAHHARWCQALPVTSGGLCDISAPQAVIQRIVAFSAAGFRAPITEPAVMTGKG